MTSRNERFLLKAILPRVSRSFYLTLAVLPSRISKQIGLAYLFARAADTIADTGHIDREARVLCLQQLKAQFLRESLNWHEIQAVQTMMAPLQPHQGERALLEQLDVCFHMFQAFEEADQREIRELLPQLIEGMEMDLKAFPGETPEHLTALSSMAELDHYTYAVAGCVGVFWTNLLCRHIPRIRRQWDLEAKRRLGIRFGKGLQLTNILRDLPRDLRRGRCYIPFAALEEVGVQPRDLLDPNTLPRVRPILQKLVGITLAHLDQGWFYTLSIPRREIRLRLACMWPILIALRTLHLLTTSHNLLDPAVSLKISRLEVYRILVITTLTGGCGSVGTAYWGHFRKAIG
ncbi:MAG: squalene/phytoene synthase family protein [Nitrospirae bacterium]|nr:MAG: squalene/phytoene synthase family protein [Nitrospirota bacterium]